MTVTPADFESLNEAIHQVGPGGRVDFEGEFDITQPYLVNAGGRLGCVVTLQGGTFRSTRADPLVGRSW